MSNHHIFHLPLLKYKHGDLVGIPPEYQPPRQKREKKTDFQDTVQDEQITNDVPSTQVSDESNQDEGVTPPLVNFSRNDFIQRNIAGLHVKHDIPEEPFPVAPVDYPLHRRDPIKEAKQQIRSLHPPLHEPPSFRSDQIGAQEQHLAVINTLVHRFISQGDYARASRAWGLLIRAMPGGTDVRSHGRWGIGAEILLKRPAKHNGIDEMRDGHDEYQMSGALATQSTMVPERNFSVQTTQRSSPSDDADADVINASANSDNHLSSSSRHDTSSNISLEGHQTQSKSHGSRVVSSSAPGRAKVCKPDQELWISDSNLTFTMTYYERLIIHHTNNRPNLTSEQKARLPNWYPALLSLWIFQITQRSKKAKLKLAKAARNDARVAATDEDGMDMNSDENTVDQNTSHVRHILRNELDGAKQISERLDDVLQTGQFRDDAQLVRIRGMVSQWIADLNRLLAQDDQDTDQGKPRNESLLHDVMDYHSEISQEDGDEELE